MRKEFALVLETYTNDIAKVELQRSSSCDGCTLCSSGKPIVLRAFNNITARKGDNVIIEVEELKKGSNIFIYILPMICLIAGYFLGEFITKFININHNLGPIFSFILFFIYVIIGMMKLKKNNKIIAKIISQNKIGLDK